jgi:hypothetical protein
MQFRAWLLLLLIPLSGSAQQGKEVRATTEDGRQVLLRPDGTWVAAPKPSAAPQPAVRPASAGRRYAAPSGDFALWLDPERWIEMRRDAGRITFQHRNGQAYAMLISDAATLTTDALRGVVLSTARNTDRDVRILAEERRMVGGHEVLCLQLLGKVQSVPFRYYGYYYGGPSGNVQLVTYTLETAFAANQADFTDLLNGLSIGEKAPAPAPVAVVATPPPLPSPPAATRTPAPTPAAATPPPAPAPGASLPMRRTTVIELHDGAQTVTVNRQKWNAPQMAADGVVSLVLSNGLGFAKIEQHSEAVPGAGMPKDPDAHITFQETRKVNNLDVQVLKVATAEYLYYSYNYAGAGGTRHIITWAKPDDFPKVEADFNELLNSFAPGR